MKKITVTVVLLVVLHLAAVAQNVGIGIAAPLQRLDVNGSIRTRANLFVDGYIGINEASPAYLFQVTDGSIALRNTTDNRYWTMNYSSAGNFFAISDNGNTRLSITTAGNIGIGTTVPAYKLDVQGSAFATSLRIDNNAVVDGDITTRGKGILRNSGGAEQLKYYTRTAAFGGTLSAFSTFSSEAVVGISSGVFTTPPQVIICGVTSTSGAADEYYKLQLTPYDVTTTSFKVKFYNCSNTASTFNATWTVVCIGE